MSALPDILIALGGVVGGGGTLKLLETWLGRQKQKTDESKQFRDELKEKANSLRVEVDALKAEIKEKEAEMDVWKERYWKIYMEYNLFQISVRAVLANNNINPNSVMPETTFNKDFPTGP
jgi:hypothetical protein